MAGAGLSVFDGLTVPVLDIDDAEDESSSYSGGSSCKGSGGGREESLVFANSLAKLDMVAWARLYFVSEIRVS
jgi:hypothetical protein